MAAILPTASYLEVLTTVCLRSGVNSANQGIQGLHLDAPEVSALIDSLLPHINSSMEALHPQHVSNALYGISGLFDESEPSTVIIYRYLKSHFDRVVAVNSNHCICLYSINHNNQ
jgi:hypothetical protein